MKFREYALSLVWQLTFLELPSQDGILQFKTFPVSPLANHPTPLVP